jgi:hypothetical protein
VQYHIPYAEGMTSVSETKSIVRQDAMDVVAESGLSKNRNFLATKASQREGPSYTYGHNGAEYDPDELKAWIEAQKAKKARR